MIKLQVNLIMSPEDETPSEAANITIISSVEVHETLDRLAQLKIIYQEEADLNVKLKAKLKELEDKFGKLLE